MFDVRWKMNLNRIKHFALNFKPLNLIINKSLQYILHLPSYIKKSFILYNFIKVAFIGKIYMQNIIRFGPSGNSNQFYEDGNKHMF